LTSDLNVAPVFRAQVAVVALLRNPGHASAPRAEVPFGAGVVVIASIVIGKGRASHCRVAGVVGARVVVGAVRLALGQALPFGALVFQCAHVAIVTRFGVERVHASFVRLARVIGAQIVVIAVDRGSRLACAAEANVAYGAHVAVLTGAGHGYALAHTQGVAIVAGAWVFVVTDDLRPGDALGVDALVRRRTGVSVVARLRVRWMKAISGVHVAQIGGAGIAIAAVVRGVPGEALPITALVSDGARIAVFAGQLVGFVHAAQLRIAVFVGAGVPIVRTDQRLTDAHSI